VQRKADLKGCTEASKVIPSPCCLQSNCLTITIYSPVLWDKNCFRVVFIS